MFILLNTQYSTFIERVEFFIPKILKVRHAVESLRYKAEGRKFIHIVLLTTL
jgi:hypothetical protein